MSADDERWITLERPIRIELARFTEFEFSFTFPALSQEPTMQKPDPATATELEIIEWTSRALIEARGSKSDIWRVPLDMHDDASWMACAALAQRLQSEAQRTVKNVRSLARMLSTPDHELAPAVKDVSLVVMSGQIDRINECRSQLAVVAVVAQALATERVS